MTLLAWFVLEETNSPWMVALVGFFGSVPLLVLSPLGGVLADTSDRQSVIRLAQVANLVSVLVMSIALFVGITQFWYAYLVIMVVGTGWALDTPSRRSAIHDLLGESRVTNGFALDSVGMNASNMIGPALGGLLIALIGVFGGFVVVAGFYLASLILLWKVRLPNSAGKGNKISAVHGLVEGIAYVSKNQALLAVIFVTVVMNLLLYPYQNMIPVIARDVLKVGPESMGLLQSLSGLGAVAGAIFVASLKYVKYHGRFYICGSTIALVALMAFSFSERYTISAVTLFILGIGTAGFSSMQATLVVLMSREDMRGKALGIISLAIGAGPLGHLLVGGMANTWYPALALRIESIAGLVCILLIAASLRPIVHPTKTG